MQPAFGQCADVRRTHLSAMCSQGVADTAHVEKSRLAYHKVLHMLIVSAMKLSSFAEHIVIDTFFIVGMDQLSRPRGLSLFRSLHVRERRA